MEFDKVLAARQSCRAFDSSKAVSPEIIKSLIAAANASPVGSGMYRDIHLTVVQNREILKKLSMAAVKRLEDKATMEKIAVDGLPKQDFDPFYGAPAAIFISHRLQNLQPGIEYANAAIIAQDIHLAATDLGLSSVLIWGALEAMRVYPELDNTGILGLPEDFSPLMGVAVGYPAKAPAPRNLPADRMTVNYL